MADRNGGDQDVPENDAAAQAASSRQYDWRPRPDPTLLTTQQLRETETALNRTITERVAGLRELLEQRLAGMDRATILLAEQIGQIDPELTAGRATLRAEFAAADQNLKQLIEARLTAIEDATRLLASNLDKSPTDTERAVGALRELLGARIDGMDKANELLAENVRQFPSDLDKATRALREVLEGMIRNVQDVAQEKFNAIDGTFASNALALTAALAAQKEAAAEQNKSNTLAITKSEQATKETIAANAAQNTNSLTSQAATISDLKDRLVRLESGGVATAVATAGYRQDATYSQADRISQQASQRATASLVVGAVGALVAVIAVIFALVHG
jgi:hypothetical protein